MTGHHAIRAGKRAFLALGLVYSSACGRYSVLQPPQPAMVGMDWVIHEVPESPILLSAPRDFSPRDRAGCFDRGAEQEGAIPAVGWTDFCVWLHSPGDPIPILTEAGSHDCLGDCVVFEEVTTTQMTLGQRDVIVQTAFAIGGPDGEARVPAILVQIPLPEGVALLQAEYGAEADAAAILGIARTISTR